MKRLILAAILAASVTAANAQKHNTYYYQRATLFEVLPASPRDILFIGNSITDGSEWHELFGTQHAKNRGISGDISEGVLDRLDVALAGHPAKIFIMIGTNDLARGISVDTVVENIGKIIDRTAAESPSTLIYLQSILPVSAHYGLFAGHTSKGEEIREANRRMQNMAAEKGVVYIDLHTPLTDLQTGEINLAYSNDGLHLTGKGYLLWRDIVAPYVKESRRAYKKHL